MTTEKATFGAGCFWGVEQTFRLTRGVVDTTVGYTGGATDNPTYEQVCAKATGHAEVVEVTYNPRIVSYDQLLGIFWQCHDPTQLNRQGPDVGDQYRTVIFFHNDVQKVAAHTSKQALEASGKFSRPIATTIESAQLFWRAEEYHQQYLAKRGRTNCRL